MVVNISAPMGSRSVTDLRTGAQHRSSVGAALGLKIRMSNLIKPPASLSLRPSPSSVSSSSTPFRSSTLDKSKSSLGSLGSPAGSASSIGEGSTDVERSRSIQISTQPTLVQSDHEGSGFFHAFRRRAVPRCRLLVRSRGFQLTMLMALLSALFLPDLWILFDRPDNSDLDVVLTNVLVLFLAELVVQSIGHFRTYWCSFFFWMDVLGAGSLLLDLSYLPIPLTSQSSGDMSNNVVIMRMARVAKLGARAGRFTKLVKLLRFLPGLSEKGANIGTAKLISSRLTTMLSTRASCLIIVIVMIMPLFSIWTFPEQDWSTTAWLEILEGMSAMEGKQFKEQLDLFVGFYSDKGYFPYLINSKLGVSLSVSAAAALPWPSSIPERRRAPKRALNFVRFETASLVCDFSFKQPTQMQSLMNILLMVFIMLLMVGFSLVLSNSVSAIVLQPLEKLLLQVRVMASTISQSVASLAVSDEKSEGHNSEDSIDDDDRGPDDVFGCETKLLEKVLQKLAVFSDLTRPGIDAATMAGMGEGDRDMLNGYVGGDRDEDYGSSEGYLDGDGNEDSLHQAFALTAMIESAGLSAELLNSWNINPLELDSARNRAAVTYFLGFHNHGVKFDPVIMGNFLEAAEAGYIKGVPYHTWYHAVDVTHGVYRLLCICGAEQYLGSLERYALLVSATCHDVGHPGLNNIFLVEASHELALRYNDKSPLENMHCARLFELMSTPKCNIFGNLSAHQFQEVRKTCIEAILHTDNVHHFPMVKEVQMLYEVNSEVLDTSRRGFSKDASFPGKDVVEIFRQPDTRKTLIKLILHVSDISNCSKPFRICQVWANKVLEEFFGQGDQERKVGIPVQALNDRDKVNRAFSQVGFIEFLVSPLFFAVVKVLPPILPCAQTMVENTKTWGQSWLKETKPEPSEAERQGMLDRIKKMETRYQEYLPH